MSTIKQTNERLLMQRERQEKLRQDDLRRLKSFDQFIAKILEQIHYMGKLRAEQKIAEVENIKQKMDKATRKLNDLMNRPENEQEEKLTNAASGPQGDNIPIEKHPLLPEMGGMPMELDNLDQEFLNDLLGVNPILDRTELQNQIKKKLEDKLKLLNKMKAENKIKARNQPSYRPVQKQINELVVKYKMALDDMKKRPVLQPEPDYKPTYQPKFVPPTLKPY